MKVRYLKEIDPVTKKEIECTIIGNIKLMGRYTEKEAKIIINKQKKLEEEYLNQ